MLKKQIEPCDGTRREVQFEWSQYSILTTDSKVRTTFPDSIIQARRERVLKRSLFYDLPEVRFYSSLKAEVERFDCIVAERNKKSEKSVSVLQTVIIIIYLVSR